MSINLTIVTPVLNEEIKIQNNLDYFESLRKVCELIFVDGGSKDATVTLLKKSNHTVITSPQAGRGAQLSFGASKASNDYLLFLHIDTQLPEDFVKFIEPLLQSYTWGHFTVKLDSTKFILNVIGYFMNLRSQLTGIATGDQALFVDKNAFLEHLDDMMKHPIMEDIYLSTVLKKDHGKPAIIKSPVITSARYWQKNGIVKSIFKMWKFRLLPDMSDHIIHFLRGDQGILQPYGTWFSRWLIKHIPVSE